MSSTINTSVRVTRGDRLLRLAKKSLKKKKKSVKSKPLSLKKPLRLKTKSPKRKPPSAPTTNNNNFASVNNIAKTIQALENLKTPAAKTNKNNNAFQFLNFGRNGAPVLMSPTARRVSSRERKAPKRYGFNTNHSNKSKKN